MGGKKYIPQDHGGALVNFEPGESGNPHGRPPGSKNRATLLKKWLSVSVKIKNDTTGETFEGTMEDKVALSLIKKALKGDVSAIKEIQDTLYGKVKDVLEIQKEQPLFPDTKNVHTDNSNKQNADADKAV